MGKTLPFFTSTTSRRQKLERHLPDPLTRNQAKPASEFLDDTLNATSVMLAMLRDASSLVPAAPLLCAAAKIALEIVTTVQCARRNKEEFERLADDACELVYAIIMEIPKAESLPRGLDGNLRQLVTNLDLIRGLANKSISRNFLSAMLHSATDAAKIMDYRKSLQRSLIIFGVQSTISLRLALSKQSSQLLDIMEEVKKCKSPGTSVVGLNASTAKEQVTATTVPGDTTEIVMRDRTSSW